MSIDNRDRGLCARLTSAYRGLLAAFAAVGLAALSCANDATVSASLSQDGTTFTAAFAGNANETNSLWVVYDATDKGSGTNGWAHVERLGTVLPGTATMTYPAPAGWGDTVKALRFVLSEVPYDYDYSTTYTAAGQVPAGSANVAQCLKIDNDDNFTMLGSHQIYVKFSLNKISTAHNQTIFLARASSGTTSPYYNLFWMYNNGGKKQFRFDYNSANRHSENEYNDPDAVVEVVASPSSGMAISVDGNLKETIARPSTAFTGATTGPLLLFAGKTEDVSNPSCAKIYACQVRSSSGDLLLDLVPMVKGGKAGMFDRVNGKVYTASLETSKFRELDAGDRVESANPFFASDLVALAAEGPTVFTPASAMTDANDYDNPDGGILNGTATLTLSGANDWGGKFTISNGTLCAAFGQGLSSTDALLLEPGNKLRSGTYGGYAGFGGRATAPFGSGTAPGAVNVAPGGYWALCAADGGDLAVDVGGAGAPVTLTSNYCRFLLNGAAGAGTLAVKNPVETDGTAFLTLVVRTGFGTAAFEKDVSGANATTPANGLTIDCYDLDNASAGCDGKTVFLGKDNRFKTLQIKSGTHGFGEGSAATLDGNLNLYGGKFFATNASVEFSGAAGYVSGVTVTTGIVEVAGGSLVAGSCQVGTEYTPAGYPAEADMASLKIAGRFALDDTISEKSVGSMTVNGTARTIAVSFDEGAEVSMVNLNFYRRNIEQNAGSTVALRGNYGLNDMGAQGVARYRLYGGTLTACRAKQATDKSVVEAPTAWFVFGGGTLVTPRNVQTPFFQDFSGESAVQVQANKTSAFQVDYSTSITNGLVHESGSWNYASADWMTAPAFTKTGAATLTLSGTSTYRCATDVAEGTLALASGDAPGVLPATGVVRLTGGTLDLGGNAQTVKGLAGTAGAVVNGSIDATDGIYPGGDGAVGSFSCGAALSGTLCIDVDAETGACDSISVPSGATLDLSGIDLVLPGTIPEGVERFRVVTGATTGEFNSVANLPSGWEMNYTGSYAQARKIMAFVLTIR
ncbi:MAG: autotransporter-associated beta strand repeat-containing protein [Kiritimatiellae bacterium]|nr:autotransporter-associated beta strand repeat-containing protein [Kiritimatiellia bacterium]